jgi:toxin HigB-1
MILSYRDKRTEAFSRGEFVRVSGFRPTSLQASRMLDAATGLEDLRALPGNRLEALKGDRAGQYSIRFNVQWRICFEWPQEATGPSNVEIVDYH